MVTGDSGFLGINLIRRLLEDGHDILSYDFAEFTYEDCKNKIKIALITSKNKPKVNTVTGRVNKTRIGFTKIFNNPSTTATMIEVVKLLT